MSKQTDWISIEGHYRAGQRALRDIAGEFGITEGAIRARAKKLGWTQNAAQTKRRLVADRMAGATQDIAQNVMRNIETAADQDIQDMRLGLKGARAILQSAVDSVGLQGIHITEAGKLELAIEPKDLKVLSECIKINVETIRKIRGLDEPEKAVMPEPLIINLPAAE